MPNEISYDFYLLLIEIGSQNRTKGSRTVGMVTQCSYFARGTASLNTGTVQYNFL